MLVTCLVARKVDEKVELLVVWMVSKMAAISVAGLDTSLGDKSVKILAAVKGNYSAVEMVD